MLMKLGYTVYETASQQEAIRICETVPVDVLLTDIVMPVMNGIDLAVKASSILPSLKVLYMSGYIDDTVLPSAYMDSGCQFIRKPFTAASLKDQIDAVLQHTVAVSARAGGH